MANIPRTVEEQLLLLKERGMNFRNEELALHFLKNISYYRLKGYWWDMQSDYTNHTFKDNYFFEDIIDRYNFDRQLRLILFDAIERIEIALRTKMIYHLSLSYGAYWYADNSYFSDINKHNYHLNHLKLDFQYSNEVFAKNHKRRFRNNDAESWKIMEIASLGTLSKFYKNIKHQLPEKSSIAKEMGLNLHAELSSWLESIVYIRNIIAHHSRLWSRNMVKTPFEKINNPQSDWLNTELLPVQKKRAFLIISSMLYICNKVIPKHNIKNKILSLFKEYPNIEKHKIGFLNNWEKQSLWK